MKEDVLRNLIFDVLYGPCSACCMDDDEDVELAADTLTETILNNQDKLLGE